MKRIIENSRQEAFRQWTEAMDEDVVLMTITPDHSYIIKALVSYIAKQKEPGFDLIAFVFNNGDGWKLSDSGVTLAQSKGLLKSFEHEGEYYDTQNSHMHYEPATKERAKFPTVYDYMCSLVPEDDITILKIASVDFSEIFDLLTPGNYLINLS